MKILPAIALLLAGCASAQQQKSTVLFMCPYGGAKSVIAASYFNRAAESRDVPFIAVAFAAETPYDAVPKPVADFLHREGFDVASFQPRQVAQSDLTSAARVISIDCDLTKLDMRNANIEHWDDVPKVSADLPGSAAAIRRHVEKLVAELMPHGATTRSDGPRGDDDVLQR